MADRRVPFVKALAPSAADRLRALGIRRTLAAGTFLLLEGDEANRVWVIEQGLVKVTSLRSDGNEAILALRGPGDVIGELAALDGGPRSATVVTVVPTDVWIVSRDAFLAYLLDEPAASLALLRELAARLRDADVARVSFAGDDVATRLAQCLLELADTYAITTDEGNHVAVTIDLPLTQADLAALVASSRDAVARALQTWRRQKLVTTSRRRIVIEDPKTFAARYRS